MVYGTGAVPDPAAIAFTAFYGALADGMSVTTACDRGNLHIRDDLPDGVACRDILQPHCDPVRDGVMFEVLTREKWPRDSVCFFGDDST